MSVLREASYILFLFAIWTFAGAKLTVWNDSIASNWFLWGYGAAFGVTMWLLGAAYVKSRTFRVFWGGCSLGASVVVLFAGTVFNGSFGQRSWDFFSRYFETSVFRVSALEFESQPQTFGWSAWIYFEASSKVSLRDRDRYGPCTFGYSLPDRVRGRFEEAGIGECLMMVQTIRVEGEDLTEIRRLVVDKSGMRHYFSAGAPSGLPLGWSDEAGAGGARP